MLTEIYIAIAGFVAQLVDGGLGMGFGITSSTMLITFAALGPAQASAVVHAAELGTTAASGLSHAKFGNVQWKVALGIAIPGAIGAFIGATLLSSISLTFARPAMALILICVGANLVWRFSRGRIQRVLNPQPHSRRFLIGLGLAAGLIDATVGGGWGPLTTSTLLTQGKAEPRRVVGTVSFAEFIVTVGATLGFVIGLRDEILAHLTAIIAMLIGGALAAPIAAWSISKLNATLLGGLVGTLIVAVNTPTLLSLADAPSWTTQAAIVAVAVVGVALSVRGARVARAARVAHAAQADGGERGGRCQENGGYGGQTPTFP